MRTALCRGLWFHSSTLIYAAKQRCSPHSWVPRPREVMVLGGESVHRHSGPWLIDDMGSVARERTTMREEWSQYLPRPVCSVGYADSGAQFESVYMCCLQSFCQRLLFPSSSSLRS
ncbi:hypothetical protein F5X96DRAFT_385100 [Biscogniauxia mediterranea]|nr:hypothetical protein F5X96DRAFT_385100 [Biscogniauxia mediterranea]